MSLLAHKIPNSYIIGAWESTEEVWTHLPCCCIFLDICCGPTKRQNVGLDGYSCGVFSMLMHLGKKKVDSLQNVKSCSSWQQDHQSWCFPNGSPGAPARTWSPHKTTWRIAGCLVLIPNVKESNSQTPPWKRITIFHPAALTIHDLAVHRILFHIPLVHCFSNCAKRTTSAIETASEQDACTAQIFQWFLPCLPMSTALSEQGQFGISALGSIIPLHLPHYKTYLTMKDPTPNKLTSSDWVNETDLCFKHLKHTCSLGEYQDCLLAHKMGQKMPHIKEARACLSRTIPK